MVKRRYQFNVFVSGKFFSRPDALVTAIHSLKVAIWQPKISTIHHAWPDANVIKKPLIITNVQTVLMKKLYFLLSFAATAFSLVAAGVADPLGSLLISS